MDTVTISKTEYQDLKKRARAYEKMLEAAGSVSDLVPKERSTRKILSAMKKTKKYNKEFLDSLRAGLARSSYFKA